jgi:ATP-dependent Lon protease
MPRKKSQAEIEQDQEFIDAVVESIALDEDSTKPEDVDLEVPSELNILPLRDSVIFPMLIAPLSVGRPDGIKLIDESVVASQRMIGVVAQKDPDSDSPNFDQVYGAGCVVIIRTLMKATDSVRMIVQGTQRFRIVEQIQTTPYLRAKIELLPDLPLDPEKLEETEALRRSVASLFEQAVRLSPQLPEDLASLTHSVAEPNVMADLIAAHTPFSVQDKQSILEEPNINNRLKKLLAILGREVRVLELTSKVHNEVTQELSRNQREYYLREQLKAIQRELGEGDDYSEDLEDLRNSIEEAKMSPEAEKAAYRELDRLQRINPGSPEYTVARTYIETIASIPWAKSTDDNLDLDHVKAILDQEHAGLDKIKERIIEFLAVRLVKTDSPPRQPILCFYGPPGVGKTSLGQSIATAMGRKFMRLSLGGMRDEAEIRGHRRTYIGSLPGQIVQGLRRAESNNPVFVLDEIDKLGNDFRGDPASAMLEVLDPQQNNAFRDHYLDVPVDLSHVFFITTANRLDTIPPALRDRMEIIELGGYTEDEKFAIATQHLVPRQLTEHGLTPKKLEFKPEALRHLIRHYTREAGVRNLEREIGSVVRKATVEFAKGRKPKVTVTKQWVQKALGAPRYTNDEIAERKLVPGIAVGLAWTPVGGDILFIETSIYPGKGLTITGQLGNVMKESVTAALSYIRANAKFFKIDPKVFEENQIHVHVPAGAVPKDGPSAGITMLTALVGLLTGRHPVERLAMTGEITLTGQVLPIGGVKEKVLAAFRSGVTTVLLPAENKKDYLEDVPEDIRAQLTAHFVTEAKQVLKLALQPDSKPS